MQKRMFSVIMDAVIVDSFTFLFSVHSAQSGQTQISKQSSTPAQLFCQHQHIALHVACCLYVLHPLSPALCWCTDFLFREGKPVCYAGEFQRKGDNPSAARLSLCYSSADKTTDPYLSVEPGCHHAGCHGCHAKCRSLILWSFRIIIYNYKLVAMLTWVPYEMIGNQSIPKCYSWLSLS